MKLLAGPGLGFIDREKWSLIEVPKLSNYKGTIWASWDQNAPDFETYLGDARVHLDQALDCREGRPGGAENFSGTPITIRAIAR